MSVYDRWHKTYPRKGDQPCECSTDERPLCPTEDHKNGDRWQVRWKDPDGKGCKKNFRLKEGKNREIHANAYDKWIQGQLASDTYTDPDAGQVLLEAYAARWRANLPESKPSTRVNRDYRLAYIYDLAVQETRKSTRKGAGESSPIGKKAMALLARRPDLIQGWIKWMEELGLAPDRIRLICGTLSGIFEAAKDDGTVGKNPFDAASLRLPPKKPKLVRPWTVDQLCIASLWMERNSPRDEAMIDVGAGAGLRQGEMFALGEDAIEFDGSEIKVLVSWKYVEGPNGWAPVWGLPKRDKIRSVPLSDPLADRLRLQIKEYPPVAVTLPWETPDGPPFTVMCLFFDEATGTAWHSADFNKRVWRPARAAAGVPATRANGMHVLRHTFASACLANGGDIRTLSEDLGHDDPGFTLRYYGHLMPGRADRTRAAVAVVLGDMILKRSALRVPAEPLTPT